MLHEMYRIEILINKPVPNCVPLTENRRNKKKYNKLPI